jgi:hypothetical protein
VDAAQSSYALTDQLFVVVDLDPAQLHAYEKMATAGAGAVQAQFFGDARCRALEAGRCREVWIRSDRRWSKYDDRF